MSDSEIVRCVSCRGSATVFYTFSSKVAKWHTDHLFAECTKCYRPDVASGWYKGHTLIPKAEYILRWVKQTI